MNRRNFTALLPALIASPSLVAKDHATSLSELKSGEFPAHNPPAEMKGHDLHQFFIGMLPDNIRMESHISYLEPGTQHEPIEKHRHTEMWLVREGTIELYLNGTTHILSPGAVGLCVAGDMHWVRNAGNTRASYFVVTVGPPEA